MKRPEFPARVPRDTGTLVLLVGIGHVFLAVLLFAGQFADIVTGGVLGAVPFNQRAGQEAAAIWFTVNGVLLVMLGQLARVHQRTARLPASPGWLFIGLGAAGEVLAPVSGFLVYVALGILWVRDSRS
jgi:pheromone shutdown protein TraB